MIDYQVISTPGLEFRREFEYAYVWVKPRVVIDARYLRVDSPRSVVLYNIMVMTYKLMALNSNIGVDVGVDDISRYIGGKIARAVRDYGGRTTVYQSDVEDVVQDCFDKEPRNNIVIFSNNKVEWKSNVRELISLTEDELERVNRLGGGEGLSLRSKLIGDKKLKYANKIMSEAIQLDTLVKIEAAVEAIKSVPNDYLITRSAISEVSGVPYGTVCKYLKMGLVDDDNVIDSRLEKSFEVNKRLEDSCMNIHKKKEIITKSKLHKDSGVSRPTIDKKLKDRLVRLSEYIEELNKKVKAE